MRNLLNGRKKIVVFVSAFLCAGFLFGWVGPADLQKRDIEEKAQIVPDQPTATFIGTGVGAIPDGTTTYGPPRVISFAVSGVTAPLTEVSVNITLTHTYSGDLDMVLAGPGGTPSLILVSEPGATTSSGFGTEADYSGTYTFTDAATGPNIWTAAALPAMVIPPEAYRTTVGGMAGTPDPPPVTSLVSTFGPLTTSQINAGPWTLTIRDRFINDVGTVTAASLTLNPLNTQTGSDVTIQAPAADASVTFTQVTGAGNTAFTAINPPSSAGTPPVGYTILGAGPAYDITTTATYTSPVTVCFTVSSVNDPSTFSSVRILHGESGQLIDRTILAPDSPAPDFATRKVCARVTTLSPFVAALAPPTAAGVEISGRVLASDGRGLKNAMVMITNSQGIARTVTTGSIGNYHFEDVQSGETYVIAVRSKRFAFAPRILVVNDNVADYDFYPFKE